MGHCASKKIFIANSPAKTAKTRYKPASTSKARAPSRTASMPVKRAKTPNETTERAAAERSAAETDRGSGAATALRPSASLVRWSRVDLVPTPTHPRDKCSAPAWLRGDGSSFACRSCDEDLGAATIYFFADACYCRSCCPWLGLVARRELGHMKHAVPSDLPRSRPLPIRPKAVRPSVSLASLCSDLSNVSLDSMEHAPLDGSGSDDDSYPFFSILDDSESSDGARPASFLDGLRNPEPMTTPPPPRKAKDHTSPTSIVDEQLGLRRRRAVSS